MRVDTEALLSESGWVRALARSLVVDAARAEDLAQDTLVAALQGRRAEGVPLRRWLAAVMRNLSRQERRGELRRSDREGRAGVSGVDSCEPTPDVLARLEGHRAVVDAVMGLHEPYRSMVVSRYFDGLAPRVIAQRQGLPVRTVHTQLARALVLLRARLERSHGEQAGAWLPILGLLIGAERPGSLLGTLTGILLMDMKVKLVVAVVALAGLAFVTRPLWSGAAEVADAAHVTPTAVRIAQPSRDDLPAEQVAAAPASERAAVTAPAQSTPVATPAAARRLYARAIDTQGQAVGGLGVRCRDNGALGEEVFRSDAGGLLEVPCESQDASLEVSDERWILVSEPFLWTVVDGVVNDVVVARRVVLEGVVVDVAGAPLEGATVRVYLPLFERSGLPGLLHDARPRAWTTQSDVQGAFRLEAGVLPGGMLVARRTGFEADLRPQPTQSTQGLTIELRSEEAGSNDLRGIVVDEHGYPVEGARVALGFEHTRSDAEGRFLIGTNAEDRVGILTALKPGMLPASLERAARQSDLPGAWPDPLILQLGGPPLAIVGHVLDEEGEPVAKATVRLLDATRFGTVEWGDMEEITMLAFMEPLLSGELSRLEVATDEQGAFRIEGLLPRAYMLAAIDAARMGYVESRPIEAGATNVILRLPAQELLPRLAGRILSLSGEPLAGVHVMLIGAAAGVTPRDRGDGEPFNEPIYGASCTADDEGRFEFKDVPSAVTHILLNGANIGFGRQFEVPAGADIENLEYRVTRSCGLEVDLTGSNLEADELALLDAEGERLDISQSAADMLFMSGSASISKGRSGVLTANEDARTLVFFSEDVEVLRMPVTLRPGETNVIRP